MCPENLPAIKTEKRAHTKSLLVFILNDTQRALRSSQNSKGPTMQTPKRFVRVQCEFFNVGGFFELEKNAALFWKLLPPNHVYEAERIFMLLLSRTGVTCCLITCKIRFIAILTALPKWVWDWHIFPLFSEFPKYRGFGAANEWQYANCFFINSKRRNFYKDICCEIYIYYGTGWVRGLIFIVQIGAKVCFLNTLYQQSFARRDHLLEIEQKMQQLWEEEKPFNIDAPEDLKQPQ